MHPWDRLQRRVVGEQLWEPRALELALAARDRDAKPQRVACGEKAVLREATVRRNGHLARPAPNAPLLKRVARYPYALHTERPRKLELRSGVPWADLERDPLPSMRAWGVAEREGRSFANPVPLVMALRRHDRPRITAEEWLTGEGAR